MKEKQKSEFASRMEEIAKEATAMVDGQKNKSVIIITTESDEDGTLAMIAIAGQGGELAKGVSELATSKEAKPVFLSWFGVSQKEKLRNVHLNHSLKMF